jgi:hypothetical protein
LVVKFFDFLCNAKDGAEMSRTFSRIKHFIFDSVRKLSDDRKINVSKYLVIAGILFDRPCLSWTIAQSIYMHRGSSMLEMVS